MFVATVACFGYAYALFFAEIYIYAHLHQIPVSSVQSLFLCFSHFILKDELI